MTATEPIACPKCGKPGGERWGSIPILCDDCSALPEPQKESEILRNWKRQVPAEYQSAALAAGSRARAALQWTPDQSLGLAIYGTPGMGKSTAVAMLTYTLGLRLSWVNGMRLREVATEMSMGDHTDDRAAAIGQWRWWERVPLLVIDDIDKARFTDAYTTRLYGLLETRRNKLLPIIWTGNLGPGALCRLIADGCGNVPLAQSVDRRLFQNFTIVA